MLHSQTSDHTAIFVFGIYSTTGVSDLKQNYSVIMINTGKKMKYMVQSGQHLLEAHQAASRVCITEGLNYTEFGSLP